MTQDADNDEMDALRERLKKVREKKGKTQAEFAEAIGVSQSVVSEMESGRTKPSGAIILGVARGFPDIDRDWLLRGGNGPMAYWDTQINKPMAGSMRFGSDQKLSVADTDALRCAVRLLDKLEGEKPGMIKRSRENDFINIIYNFYIGAYQDAGRFSDSDRPDRREYAEKMCAEWAERLGGLSADEASPPKG